MLRTTVLGLLCVAAGVLMYPDASAREQDPHPQETVIRGSIVKGALQDITHWIVAPKDWKLEELLALPKEQDPSTTKLVEETVPPVQKPSFAYSDLVLRISDKYGMDWRLVASVIAVESSFNPKALSPKGARGLMQLMPTTAALYRVPSSQLYEPERNIEAGVQHLRWLSDRYTGNLEWAVAAYNSGEAAVDKYRGIPPFRPTQQFVRRVMAHYQNHLLLFPAETRVASAMTLPVAPIRPASGR